MSEIRAPRRHRARRRGRAHVRAPLVITEPVAEGAPNVRADLVVAEPVVEGAPGLRVPCSSSKP
jgi:hypothetical protein